MDDLKNIRKRIKSRRYHEADEEKHHSFSLFRFLYHLVMLMMCLSVLALALLLNQKLNLIKLPTVLTNFKIENLASWLPFENWFSLKEVAVVSKQAYTLLKDDQYANGSNSAFSIYDSVVLHVKKASDNKYSVTLKQDNGVVSTYGNIKEASVKQDERILKGKPVGTFDNYVTLNFLKDNNKITYDAALQKN
ncbi:MAG: M23 family peptidase [Longicatena sp.]